MWTVANRHIVPSAQEAQHIKRTIKRLETELVAARKLERAQECITELERDLEQEKASISPIRRVPGDVLSEIFQICCKEERLAPIIIAAVCYRWRETIIGTPLAWTRIFPQNYRTKVLPKEYVSLFLERSQPCLLHLAVPWRRGTCVCFNQAADSYDIMECDCFNVEIIFEHAARIQCLTADVGWMVEYSTVIFDNLTRLTISNEDTLFINPFPLRLNISRFPKLYYLDISDCPAVNEFIDFSHVTRSQLKCLSIGQGGQGYWLDVVKACATSVQTLRVAGEFIPSSTQTIEFPQLESLTVKDEAGVYTVDSPVLEVVAPYLAFFEAICEAPPKVVHHCKSHKVTHLRTRSLLSLRDYPLLRILHISWGMIDGILVQLERDLSVCPGLKIIELSTMINPFIMEHHSEDQLQRRVAERNSGAGSDIELVFNERSPDKATAYPTCTDDMPCRQNLEE